jgi:hypothetical protein
MTATADRRTPLAQANARRHEAALAAAEQAIERLGNGGQQLSFGAVAHAAGVSRGWLYRQPQLRALIEQLRHDEPAPKAHPASLASLRQRLDNARAEIARLRTENDALRNQLARHLGTQRVTPPSPARVGGDGDDMSPPRKPPKYRAITPIA